jgi:hypothetical protein
VVYSYDPIMSSLAYARWTGYRAEMLDQLMSAHAAVEGSGRGRRWRTEQLNWALTMRLAGEFQGFCRDLHDDAVDFFEVTVSPSPTVASVIHALLTANRKLDKGNAHPGALQQDFELLGLDLKSGIFAASPARGLTRWVALGKLNEARNAIAHANHAKLITLRQEGYPIVKRTILTWRSQLDALAETMDDVVARSLGTLLGVGRPW